MKMIPIVLVMVVSLGLLTGCLYVRPKAETILAFQESPEAEATIRLGFRDTIWTVLEGHPVVIGRGVHPREHETTMFFLNEPYPAFQPRWILVRADSSGGYELIIWSDYLPGFSVPNAHGIRLIGHLQEVIWQPEQPLYLDLHQVMVSAADDAISLRLSGHIEARPTDAQTVEMYIQRRQDELQHASR